MRSLPTRAAAAALLLLAGCGGVTADCTPGGDGSYVTSGLYPSLSSYCMLTVKDGSPTARPGVTPYELNTPLFTDYAVKYRTVWVPPGKQATWSDTDVIDFPVGSIVTKSFGLRDDLRKANPVVRWIETRVMVRQASGGWKGASYAWDASMHDAKVNYGGGYVAATFLDESGATVTPSYIVPNGNQCITCHAYKSDPTLIGPKARNLNRTHSYDTGDENQLAHWVRTGLLAGAPADPTTVPKLAVWNDPSTGTTAERARAYLEVNCAHCHSENGFARTTGLYLWASVTEPDTFGVCKPPVAVGEASGGFLYDVVAGDPDHSIMAFRMGSTMPAAMMPQIGRSLVDKDGLALVSDWITGLKGTVPDCKGH